MQIGMVGLGRMGGNMARRLLRGGHEVVVYNRTPDKVQELAAEGAVGTESLRELVDKLALPRAVWVMVPAGDPTAETLTALAEHCDADDAVVDGGNTRYTASVAHARMFAERGIEFVDAGTSGGIWGLELGYCLMVGGSVRAFARLEPVFRTLAPRDGYAHVGPAGTGHFTKMVHNGIEYGLMQAYAEGFELLKSSEFELDVPAIAEVWRHGSVVRSWLLDLAASALAKDPELAGLSDYVEDSGEGRWTVQTAVEHGIPTPTIALSLFARFASRRDPSFAGKVLNALRREFGGHPVRKSGG